MALRLGVCSADLAEALLRERPELVIAVIEAPLPQPGKSLGQPMGSTLDAAKTISSLTLFEAAGQSSATSLLDRLSHRCRSNRRHLQGTGRG